MDYQFIYKPKFERKTFKERISRNLSDFIFYLYRNRLFKKLKLDKNSTIKSSVWSTDNPFELLGDKFSKKEESFELDIHSVTLLDCVELEDSQKLKQSLLKLVPLSISSITQKRIDENFNQFEASYKTISMGKLFSIDTTNNEKLDLIDRITCGFVKGAESHCIILYTLYPSAKYKELITESLKQDTEDETEIIFNPLKQILKTKRIINSVVTHIIQEYYQTEKLLNEITFRFKNEALTYSGINLLSSNKQALFPRIVAYRYPEDTPETIENSITRKLNISPHDLFKCESGAFFSFNTLDYSKAETYDLNIVIPNQTNARRSIDDIVGRCINDFAPFWLLIHISKFQEERIIKLRKKSFEYIRKNKFSLFLKKVIRMKNLLTLSWINFERIRNDFHSDIFKNTLYKYYPDAISSFSLNDKKREFKDELVAYTERLSVDIKNTYEELLKLHSHIEKDNSLRANMQLQKILFVMTLVGVLLAIYGSNSSWFNSWIEYFLNLMEIEIPRVNKYNSP